MNTLQAELGLITERLIYGITGRVRPQRVTNPPEPLDEDSVPAAILAAIAAKLPEMREPDGLAGGYQYIGYNSAIADVRKALGVE